MADPYNASDPKHVKGRKGREKQEAIRDAEAFTYVMSDVRGRNFVWWLLSASGLYNDSFTGNSSTFYNEGKRSVGLRLIKDLEETCPQYFITMWQEHLIQQEKEQRADEADRTESINGNHHSEEEF